MAHEEHSQAHRANGVEHYLDSRNQLWPTLYLADDADLHVIDPQGGTSGVACFDKVLWDF